jgi:XRE family transcriptional regulator, regulator of sulfur utilization
MNKEAFLKEIGNRVRIAREQKGISQEKLAELSRLTLGSVGGIERGERNVILYNYVKIAKILDLRIDELIKIFHLD